MAERQLPKLNVAGSIPVSRSIASLGPSVFSLSNILSGSACGTCPPCLPNCLFIPQLHTLA